MRKWCKEHKPEKEICPAHGLRWLELHSEELHSLNLEALFYCPEFGCDEFTIPQGSGSPGSRVRPTGVVREKDEFIGSVIFSNFARLKILYHKLAMREGD